MIRIDRGSILGRHVAGFDDILNPDGNAMKRSHRRDLIACTRLCQRQIGIQVGPSLDVRFAQVDAFEAGINQGLRCDASFCYHARGIAGGYAVKRRRFSHALFPLRYLSCQVFTLTLRLSFVASSAFYLGGRLGTVLI